MELSELVSQSHVEPRPYQERIVSKAVEMFEGRFRNGLGHVEPAARSVMIESPTGSGKTVMGLLTAKLMQERHGLSVGWVAMRRNLLGQTAEENRRQGIDARPIHFVSMFDKNPPTDIDLLVVDEAQHDAASSMAFLHNRIRPKFIVGLTATPFRADRIKLCFDKVIKDAGIHQLIQDGYLSQYEHYTVPNFDVQSVSDFYLREPERWGKTIVFFHRLSDCFELEAVLRGRGVRCETVTGSSDREAQIERFRAGQSPVLINCMVLTEGFDCFSEDTEILTDRGWVYGRNIGPNDNCWSLNKETGCAQLVPIDAVAERQLRKDESMMLLRNQHLNLLVSEGHQFHFKYRDPSKAGNREARLSHRWQIQTAKELSERRSEWQLPLAAEACFPGLDLTDDEIRFLGWAQTDGHFPPSGAVEIYQSENPSKFLDYLRLLLDRLGFQYSERRRAPENCGYPTKYGLVTFYIHAASIKHLRPWLSKADLSAYSEMDRRQFAIFIEEMRKADGSLPGAGKSAWIWIGNQRQADAIQAMALVRGFACNLTAERTQKGNIVYRLSPRDVKWIGLYPNDPRSTRFERHRYSGKVWCLKNCNGTVFARRGGKVAIVGNCPDLETVFCRDSAKGPTMQMCGRAFRKHPAVPVKRIVQSKLARYPFTKIASARRQWLWQEDEWRSLEVNPRINLANARARQAIAATSVELPMYIRRRGGGEPIWSRFVER